MHRHYIRVYFEDTDAGGIVYHANYLRFAERARTEALRDAGAPHAEMLAQFGLIFVVRRIEIDYLRPARLDAWLCVQTTTRKVAGVTVDLVQEFLQVKAGQVKAGDVKAGDGEAGNGEDRLGVARIRLACVAVATGRPARIPPRWRDVLMLGCNAAAAAAEKETESGSYG